MEMAMLRDSIEEEANKTSCWGEEVGVEVVVVEVVVVEFVVVEVVVEFGVAAAVVVAVAAVVAVVEGITMAVLACLWPMNKHSKESNMSHT